LGSITRSSINTERVINLLADIGRTVSSALSIASALGAPVPTSLTVAIGSATFAAYLARKLWRMSIFDLSRKELEAERIRVAEKLKELKAELKYLEDLKAKCSSDEACKHLELRIVNLRNQVKALRDKLYAIDIVEIVKENEELFRKYLGNDVWRKIVENPDKFREDVEKRLPDLEALREAMPQLLSQMTAELEEKKLEEKPEKVAEIQSVAGERPVAPQPPSGVVVDMRLLLEGEVEEWLSLLKDALSRGVSMKFPEVPPSRYIHSKGFRNLLIALIELNIGGYSTQQLFREEKHVYKLASLIVELREGPVRVKPTDSKKVDMDLIIEVLTRGEATEKQESVEGNMSLTIYTYKFRSFTGRELTIMKTVVKDLSGRAREIEYKLTGLLDNSN